jgi:pimeloyl-ACP methyl ester carboxylesterase
MANRPKSHVNKKWLFALAAILLMIGIAVPFAIGWALAAPVQISVGKAPSDLDAETVEFESDSGAIVKGWWCRIVNSRGVVLLLPGIRANRLSMVDRARFLRRAGYSVLLIDFQATGETKGDHITFGWKESRDALAAVDFIHHVDPSARVAIIGSSLGGVAALLATPPLKVNALILESVYPTIEIATRNRMENYLGHNRPDVCASLFDAIAPADWRFTFAVASDRSRFGGGLPSPYHERRERSQHQTGRHANSV